MDSKNIIIGILALTTAGGCVFGYLQNQRANQLQANVGRLDKAFAQEQRAKRAEVQPQSSEGDGLAQSGTDQAGDRQNRANWQARSANFRALMQTPEATKLMASQQRAMLDGRYATLFKNLNLTPDQLAKFKDMLMEKQNAARDVVDAAREQGLDMRSNRDDVRQLIQQSSVDIDANIASLIGPDKLAQYQNYDQTQVQRSVVSQLEQHLSYTDAPLTSDQSNQLVALLATQSANSGASDAGGGQRVFMAAFNGPPGGGPLGGFGGMAMQGTQITDQVISAAQNFLSASQVNALRDMQSQQADQQKLQQLIRSSFSQNNDSGNTDASAQSNDQSGGRHRNR